MIHGHGDDLYRSEAEVRANFSTNVWYEADMKPLCHFLETRLERIYHYPEPDAGSFCKVAADYHDVLPENVLAGNGATELFYLVAHAFAGHDTLLPIPSFKEYEDACSLYQHHITFVSHTNSEDLLSVGSLMFICNPNNPDGRIWSEKEIRAILSANPDRVVVVDESFIWFAPEASTAVPLLREYPNLLIIRSMTKCYAIPGLRLGYLLGDKHLIAEIARFTFPWSVNALAIEAGKFLLQSGDSILPDATNLLERQRCFSAQIAALPGFQPLESHTSFFLVHTDADVPCLKQWLLQNHGLLIRDASNFRGLDKHYFRINTLTDSQNNLLLEALQIWNSVG